MKKVGKFYITRKLSFEYDKLSETLSYMKFVPLRVEYLLHKDELELIGESYLFDDIEKGFETPTYEIIVNIIDIDKDEYKDNITVSVRRIN